MITGEEKAISHSGPAVGSSVAGAGVGVLVGIGVGAGVGVSVSVGVLVGVGLGEGIEPQAVAKMVRATVANIRTTRQQKRVVFLNIVTSYS